MIHIASYGPWAVVTGASSGIGRAFARHLAEGGLNLVLSARSTEEIDSLGRELAYRHGIAFRTVTADLRDPGAVSLIAEATADLDVGLLVSNAGAGRPGRLLEQSLETLHGRFTLNAVSHLDLVHEFGRRFGKRRRSGIILISALGAGPGIPYMAHDAASKAYVLSLGGALHNEFAPDGVAVTVVQPGNVDTPVIDAYGIDRSMFPIRPLATDRAVRGAVKAFLKGRAVHIPGRRMALLSTLMPRAMSVWVNGRMMGAAARNLAEREALASR
ncbi:SDR family oxidoreductase [Glycomyces sp. YM15]|uniref:SDR family NAD(P)-dependent oxidoreductase n=1 Tax=Glycomyces sp. YM15 TaxID=2800446 RepID=UPI00196461C2|nr:SDR family NAD(P)-dependent oxidoreductase [Glycomyces sp. YM15]